MNGIILVLLIVLSKKDKIYRINITVFFIVRLQFLINILKISFIQHHKKVVVGFCKSYKIYK